MLWSSAEGGPVAEENPSQQLRFQQVSESRVAKADGKENTENLSLPEVSSVGCSPGCSFFGTTAAAISNTFTGSGGAGANPAGPSAPGLAAASSSGTGDTRPPSASTGTSTGMGPGPASALASAPARELGLSAAWFAQKPSSWGRCWIVLVEFKKNHGIISKCQEQPHGFSFFSSKIQSELFSPLLKWLEIVPF